MISRIEAKNYRCFKQLAVDLPQVALLVGPNGSGKTTLLDIPRVVADALRSPEGLTAAFQHPQANRPPRCRDLRELLFRRQGDECELALELRPTESDGLGEGRTFRYELKFALLEGRLVQVQAEFLYSFDDKQTPDRDGGVVQGSAETTADDWRAFILRREPDGMTTLCRETDGASQVERQEGARLSLALLGAKSEADYPAGCWFYRAFTRDLFFYSPDWQALRYRLPPAATDEPLRPTADNIAQVIQQLSDADREHWNEVLRQFLPDLAEVKVYENERDHFCEIEVCFRGGEQEDHTLTGPSLSLGTLKLLAFTLLNKLAVPAVFVAEELENGVGPKILSMLWGEVESLALESQVLVSTHSPLLVSQVQPEDLLCLWQTAEGSQVARGDEHPRFSRLVEWRQDFSLGELLAGGVFS